ncbi:unnamed protein product [Alopecurus aequalis]
MAAPPPLNDDVTAEILLRLPPDEPEHLLRAALVCKPWLSIICDPGFRRRYREFHGAPPLLGLLHHLSMFEGQPIVRFASTTSMPEFPYPDSDATSTRPLDCRHGRVLLHLLHGDYDYLVWDPVTGDRHSLAGPEAMEWIVYSAAVLCATDGCDHLHCHGGHFRVVFVAMATRDGKSMILANVYSSETRVWSVAECHDKSVWGPHSASSYYMTFLKPTGRGALVGDALYFTLGEKNSIVKYDLVKNCLSRMDPAESNESHIALMAIDNNSTLGFACILGSRLYIWSNRMDAGEGAEWVQCRVIELERTMVVASSDKKLCVVGFAEGVDVIFVSSDVGLFRINLNSGQVKKVDQPDEYFSVLPYMSFYLPDHGAFLSLVRTH